MGLVNDRYVEIRSGLNEGDQVIYAGYESLKEGDAVVPTKWGPSGPLSLPPATGEAAPGTVYTCPMHPEVKSDKPGDCPKCGMKLQLAEPSASGKGASPGVTSPTPATKSTGYYCPMHPEVRSQQPGKCPKCGMDLQPVPQRGSGR